MNSCTAFDHSRSVDIRRKDWFFVPSILALACIALTQSAKAAPTALPTKDDEVAAFLDRATEIQARTRQRVDSLEMQIANLSSSVSREETAWESQLQQSEKITSAFSALSGGVSETAARIQQDTLAVAAHCAREAESAMLDLSGPHFATLVAMIGPEQAEFEISKSFLISALKSFDLDSVPLGRREAVRLARDALVERVAATSFGQPEASLIAAAGDGVKKHLCDFIPFKNSPAGIIGKFICEKLVDEALDKAVEKGIEVTKEQYEKYFKDLSLPQALECVNRAVKNSGAAWLQNNVNICTLAPEYIYNSQLPSEVIRILCPMVITSFETELKMCVEQKQREKEERERRESESNDGPGIDKGGDGPRNLPNRSPSDAPKDKPDKGPKEPREPKSPGPREPTGPRDPKGPPGKDTPIS